MKTWTGAVTGALIALLIIVGVSSYFTYGSGTLVVKIMDPPSHWGPASQVYINCSAIMIHRAGAENESGWSTVVENVGWINLTETVNVSRTIGQGSLQAGLYNVVRFKILDAKITVKVEGQECNVTATVEPNELTVPITEGGVRVNAGQTVYLVIDINPIIVGSLETGFKIVPAARALPHQ